jgi:hypothetical protein
LRLRGERRVSRRAFRARLRILLWCRLERTCGRCSKKFDKGDVEQGVLEPVVEIVRCAQERRYVDANDSYLRLSIGKA